jgi:uncharacterized protein
VPDRIHHRHGNFCGAGLATSDPSAATQFYSRLFGWEAEELSAAGVGRFTLLQRDGKDTAILYRQTAEARAARVRPHWTPFISVVDADETAVRAEELGGGRIRPVFDVLDLGRVAALHDPAGAILSLWQPGSKGGAESVSGTGPIQWNELATSDPERAMSFYGNLLGWRYCVWDDYMTIHATGRPAGGIRRPLPTEDAKAPRWLSYLFVPSAGEAADEAQRAGGEILVPPTETAIPGMAGRFALISDPLGADFAVYEDRGAVTA